MPDAKASAFPAVSSVANADLVPVLQGGANKLASAQQLKSFVDQNVRNASVANQTGFSVETYLVGSAIDMPDVSKHQARMEYRCLFNVVKTAAGTATPLIRIRFGTAGSTADTQLLLWTFGAGTAAVDEGQFEIACTFRTIGSGTSAVLAGICTLTSNLTTTGLSNAVKSRNAVSAGFNSTLANAKIGVTVNGGTSAAWTVNLVQADLLNLI